MNTPDPLSQDEKLVRSTAPLLYKVEEAADLLRLSRATMFRLVATGDLRSVKIGSARRIPADALDAFVAGLGAS